MDKRDIIKRLGKPDRTIDRRDRHRSRSWMCSNCRAVTKSAKPEPLPAPCTKCGGVFFEDVETGLH